MIRTFLAFASLPLALGLYNSFEDNSDLSEIAQNVSTVLDVDAGNAFNLGGDRTVGGALDSCLFQYDTCSRF